LGVAFGGHHSPMPHLGPWVKVSLLVPRVRRKAPAR
jgi:hypothetical protein